MTVTILVGDCRDVLRTMADESVHCIVTSPPYFGLRDYGVDGQMGLEPTPDEFVEALVGVLRETRRVLRDDGTLWLNLGDSYYANGWESHRRSKIGAGSFDPAERKSGVAKGIAGLKTKDLIGIPWRTAFALQADGWYLRQDIIWQKPNPMPESVIDRCTKSHEYMFLLSKSPRYYFDAEAIKEAATNRPPGSKASDKHIAAALTDPKARTKANLHKIKAVEFRNRRSVWTVSTHAFAGAHFATFPPALIEPCVLAGCPAGGVVLDPFGGAGTTGLVASQLGRNAVLIELNPAYAAMARERIDTDAGLFAGAAA